MILVDTSSWIHFLRPDGSAAVRARVERQMTVLLEAGPCMGMNDPSQSSTLRWYSVAASG